MNTIRQFEGGKTATPHRTTLKTLQAAFEDAGIEFLVRDERLVGLQFKEANR